MEKIRNKFKGFLESRKSIGSASFIMTVGFVLVAMIIFQAGVFVGFHKANYGRNWNNHYYENFAQKQGGQFMPRKEMMGLGLPNPHGANGKIIKIELPIIIVADKDNTEKVVIIGDDTKIIKQKTEISSTELDLDDFVVIIGNPNDQGQIKAKLIRLLPYPGEIPMFDKH